MVDSIGFFHENQQRFQRKDINGYKNLIDLEEYIVLVKSEIRTSELKKAAKNEKDIIYKDDRWLVISPKSHIASCAYGAGTKWCITTKDNDSYWKQYSKNASFFFIIDKSKSDGHRLSKVAYRRIGRKDRYELWDAEDSEISKDGYGERWFNELPKELKEATEKYHRISFVEGEGKDLDGLSPQGQALADHLGIDDASDIDEQDYDFYGLQVFDTADGQYAVGDDGEADNAHKEWAENYIEEFGPEELDPDGYYLEMRDETAFIDEEVSHYIEEFSDEEIIEYSSYEDIITHIKEKIENENFDEDESMEILQDRLSTLIGNAKEEVEEHYRNEWEMCFSDGPVGCLVNEKGWYTISQLMDSGIVDFDSDGLANSMVSDGYRGDALNTYDGSEEVGEDLEGDTYYIFRTN